MPEILTWWDNDSTESFLYQKRYRYRSSSGRIWPWRIYRLHDFKYYVVNCSDLSSPPSARPKLGPYTTLKAAKMAYFLTNKHCERSLI